MHTLKVLVTQLQLEDGHMIPASKWGKVEKVEKLELSPEETAMQGTLRDVWASIVGSAIDDHSDFFKSGAGSMDVVR